MIPIIIWSVGAIAAYWKLGPHPTIRQMACKTHIHCVQHKLIPRIPPPAPEKETNDAE
jgi:hypothetical protein